MKIDPRAEWAQIYDEAWRINRDYFYAPNMHGVDWAAAKQKYAQFLPDASTKADVNRVIQWLMSELSVGHHRGGGGDRLTTPRAIPGGLLGADYTVANGRYRFAKIYGGLNWTPALRAPLTEPGVNVKEGDYLLAVRGLDVRVPNNLYSFFENTSGQDHRDHRRPQRRRHRLAHRAGRADRERGCAAQSRLGRGQPAKGGLRHRRPRRVRLRAEHRAAGL